MSRLIGALGFVVGSLALHGAAAQPSGASPSFLASVASQSPGIYKPSGIYAQHGADWVMGACISRERQSPINFDDHLKDPPEGFLNYNYNIIRNKELVLQAKDGLVFIDITEDLGGVVFNQEMYTLTRIDFHSPAEHLIKGERHPLEIQLVHRKRSDPKRSLVIAILVWSEYKPEVPKAGIKPVPLPEEGEYVQPLPTEVDFNPYLQNLLTVRPPSQEGATATIVIPQDKPFDLGTLVVNAAIEGSGTYIQYSGSLTSPPCFDRTTWFVRRNPMIASDSQVKAFAHSILKLTDYQGNFRTVMPVNGRALAVVEARWSPVSELLSRPVLPLGPNARTDGEFKAKEAAKYAAVIASQSLAYMHDFAGRLKRSTRVASKLLTKAKDHPELDREGSQSQWDDVVRRTAETFKGIIRSTETEVDRAMRDGVHNLGKRAAVEGRVAAKMLLHWEPPPPKDMTVMKPTRTDEAPLTAGEAEAPEGQT